MTSCTYEELIDEYQDQLQLLTGWLGLHLNFIEYEIMASGIDYILSYHYNVHTYIHTYVIMDFCGSFFSGTTGNESK